MFNIDEIFSSINGETLRIGEPTTFVRLTGCNLNCTYCDTREQESRIMNLTQVVNEVESLGVKNVCITGGEPMLNPNTPVLAKHLTRIGYDVYIETNGSITLDLDNTTTRRFRYIMDIKCPSSEMEMCNAFSNLIYLKPTDEVKFVIANKKDFDFAMRVLKEFPTQANLLFSPMFEGNVITKDALGLVDWLMSAKLENYWRVQVQIHKLVNAH